MISWAAAFALIFANAGYSEYISISFSAVILLVFLGFNDKKSFLTKKTIFQCIIIALILILYGGMLSIINGTEVDTWYSILSHARESVMLLFTSLYVNTKNSELSRSSSRAGVQAGTLVAVVLVIQALQLWGGMSPIGLSKSWFMIDYGTSFLNSHKNGEIYIRPSAFYSEPSVVAAVLVPTLYLLLRDSKWIHSLFIFLAILMCGSVYGLMASIVVALYRFKHRKASLISLASAAALFFVLANSYIEGVIPSRLLGILSGSDESLSWRFILPYDYLKSSWGEGDFGPKQVAYLMNVSTNYYNASIFDTWFIYCVAKLGLVLGVFWILFVLVSLPFAVCTLFVFYAFISGAPLYHDKVLMLMIYGLAIKSASLDQSVR